MNKIISPFVWASIIFTTVALFPLSVLVRFVTFPFDDRRVIFHYWVLIHSYILSLFLPCGKIRITGLERIRKDTAYVIIANHQSMLDIFVLNRFFRDFRWISKIENLRVPIIGWYLRMAGYIPVERGNKESRGEMIAASVQCLEKGISVMIFPEGTRSADGNIGFFKTGAFEMALLADKPVLPVVIDGTGRLLPKKSRVFDTGTRITAKVLDPVFPGSFQTSDQDELAARFRKIITGELEQLRAREQ